MKTLSPTQITILENAATRPDGNIEPLPSTINAGIKQRVIDGLLNRSVVYEYNDYYKISALGLTAIHAETHQETEKLTESDQPPTKTPREGSKLAAIVALLQRDGGVTLDELMEATQWQAHTLRGTFAGSLKKRFGFEIKSIKEDGQPRYYFIETELSHNE